MPDFAAKKKPKPKLAKPKERVIVEAGSTRENRGQTEERPANALRRMLRDFQSGLKVLQQTQGNTHSTQKLERATHSATHTHSREPGSHTRESITRERVQQSFSAAPAQSKRAKAVRPPVDRTIRMPSTAVSPRPARPTPQLGTGDVRKPVVSTGADKEAYRQLTEKHEPGNPRHEPAPARLAQILRADELIRAGEAQPNAQVQSWAKAIRAGRRRHIADIDAHHVQKTLRQALGGAERAAQLLNTPQVAKLTQQHQSSMEMLQKRLEAPAGRAGAAGRAGRDAQQKAQADRNFASGTGPSFKEAAAVPVGAVEHDQAELDVPGTLGDTRVAHAPGAASSTRSNIPVAAPVNPDRQEAELLGMLMNNDTAHTTDLADKLSRTEHETAAAGGSSGGSSAGSAPAAVWGRRRERALGNTDSAPRNIQDVKSAPSRQQLSPPAVAGQQGSQKGSGQVTRLEGTLRIPGLGQEARIEGELR